MSSNTRAEHCQACDGAGWFYDHAKRIRRCSTCGGRKTRKLKGEAVTLDEMPEWIQQQAYREIHP